MEERVVDPVLAGFLAAGLAIGVGALPALATKKASDRLLDALLGFAAWVMIAASMFGLLVPSFRLGGVPITHSWVSSLGSCFWTEQTCSYRIGTASED
jgi:ZIP family zinc transporter